MYYEHFGLDEAPFKITPDTRLFYEGGSRGDVLEALVYAISSGEGMVKVVGEVGSGKTMLSRMLEVRLSDNVEIVYLANPSIAPSDILFAIAVEMNIEIPDGTDRIRALHILQDALLSRHSEGRQVVCFVEEAQSMPLATLEEVRLLSNLETRRAKLLQIVLFGQPELDENLNEPSIRQLRERIVHSFYLDPLQSLDVGSYLSFRMRAVGYRGPDVFSKGAIKALSRCSHGLIRRVNILGDKALLAAYADNAHQVEAKHVRTAVRDSEFGRVQRPSRWALAGAAAGVAGVALAIGIGASLWYLDRFGEQADMHGAAPAASASSVPGESALARSAIQPLEPSARADVLAVGQADAGLRHGATASGRTRGPITGQAGAVDAASHRSAVRRSPPDVGGLIPVDPDSRRVSEALLSGASAELSALAAKGALAHGRGLVEGALQELAAVVRPQAATTSSERPRVAVLASQATSATPAPVPPPAPVTATVHSAAASDAVEASAAPVASVQEAQPAAIDDAAAKPLRLAAGDRSSPPADVSGAALLEVRLRETQSWLGAVDGAHFSIQLLVTSNERRANLEAFLARWHKAGDVRQLYVYVTSIKGVRGFSVLYNEFNSLEEAQAALAGLPESLKRHRPFIRNIKDIDSLG